jgi:hypothetical protein
LAPLCFPGLLVALPLLDQWPFGSDASTVAVAIEIYDSNEPTHELTHHAPLPSRASNRRCRYAGLRLLVPRLGAQGVLARCPGLIPSLLSTTVTHPRMSSPASQLLLKLLDHAGPLVSRARASWLDPLAESLMSTDPLVRKRASEYLLPSLLRSDPPAFAPLLRHIRSAATGEGEAHNAKLWALVLTVQVRWWGGHVTGFGRRSHSTCGTLFGNHGCSLHKAHGQSLFVL